LRLGWIAPTPLIDRKFIAEKNENINPKNIPHP